MHIQINTTNAWKILYLIVIVGLTIRLYLAPLAGHSGDLAIVQSWMHSAVEYGVPSSFDKQVEMKFTPGHGPVAIYIYYAAGRLYQKFISPQYEIRQPAHRISVKLPAILADLWISIMLFVVFKKTRNNLIGLFAAATYAFHPAAIYTSAFWGQTDSIWVAFLLSTIVALNYGWYCTVGIFGLLACLHKPQAMIFLPLLVFLLPWKKEIFLRVINAVMAFLAILLMPFWQHGNILSAVRLNTTALGMRSNLSESAYNLWWAIFGEAAKNIKPSVLLLPHLNYQTISIILFLGIYCIIVFALRKRLREPSQARMEVILVTASIIASAFFLFSMAIHERYLFPFLVFGIPLLFKSYRGVLIYVAISLTFIFNLMLMLTLTKIAPIFSEYSSAISRVTAWSMLLLFVPHFYFSLQFRRSPTQNQEEAPKNSQTQPA